MKGRASEGVIASTHKVKEEHITNTNRYDAGADKEPTYSPPQPETEGLFSNHHLNVFNQTVPSCKAWQEQEHEHVNNSAPENCLTSDANAYIIWALSC